MKKTAFYSIVLGAILIGAPSFASEAYISQIGAPHVSVSVPTIQMNTPTIELIVPTPQISVGDLTSLFSYYSLPSATAGSSIADLWQEGDDNTGMTMQVGDANASLISQTGNHNFGQTVQLGSFNRSGIYQTGDYFHASVAQYGSHNSAMIIQSH